MVESAIPEKRLAPHQPPTGAFRSTPQKPTRVAAVKGPATGKSPDRGSVGSFATCVLFGGLKNARKNAWPPSRKNAWPPSWPPSGSREAISEPAKAFPVTAGQGAGGASGGGRAPGGQARSPRRATSWAVRRRSGARRRAGRAPSAVRARETGCPQGAPRPPAPPAGGRSEAPPPPPKPCRKNRKIARKNAWRPAGLLENAARFPRLPQARRRVWDSWMEARQVLPMLPV